jgi:photosystem II stability/assembly factor-like uncharacterized protein
MRLRTVLTGFATGSLLAVVSLASAAPATWTRIGPEGGSLCALAAAPSQPATLYAGLSDGGVFQSVDQGRTWTFAGSGLGRLSRACFLAVDPARPATVWAGTATGLFLSRNGGATWAARGTGLHGPFGLNVAALAIHPRQPGILWAALLGSGLFKTTDGGATWSLLSPDGPTNITAILVNPLHPVTLWAGTAGQGVLQSHDGGVTWTQLTGGLSPSESIRTMALDPRNPRNLFLSTPFLVEGPQVYRSTDGGASWRPTGPGLPSANTDALAVDPVSSVVYAALPGRGVFRSTDGGVSWHATGHGISSPNVKALAATRSGLYAGSYGGVFFTADRGATWRAGRGLFGAEVVSLAAAGRRPVLLYAADELNGVAKTTNRGASWSRLGPNLGPNFPFSGPVGVDPQDPDTVYAGFVGTFARSTDGGRRWTRLGGIGCTVPTTLEIDPAVPSNLYIGGHPWTLGCGECFNYKSADSGASWSCLKSGPAAGIGPVLAIDPFAPAHLFAGGSGGLYRSTDRGASWSLWSPGLQADLLTFDPLHPSTLYAAVPGGAGRSTDGGRTWSLHSGGLPAAGAVGLAVDPVLPSTLYLATSYQVFRSTDSAATWAPLPGTGLDEVLIYDLKIDPSDPSILYIGTLGGGVMMLKQ